MKKFLKVLMFVCVILVGLLAMTPVCGFIDCDFTASAAEESKYSYKVIDGEVTIREYLGTEEKVVIPDEIEGYPVTVLQESSFKGGEFTEVVFPDTLNIIGPLAFNGCENLRSIIIPESVTSIGESAFSDCENLESIDISDGITYVGGYAFSTTAYYYNEDNWENDVLYLDYCLLNSRGSKETYEIKSGTKVISAMAFACNSNLISLDLPEGIITIGSYAFEECTNLESIRIPDSVTMTGVGVFNWCRSLRDIKLGKGLTEITTMMFWGTNINRIVIPESITSIYGDAFDDCENLTCIHYCGTEEQWQNVNIINNTEFLNVLHIATDEDQDGLCDVCGYYMNHTDEYTVTETVPSTCTENGYKVYTCSCGDSYKVLTPKLPHSYTPVVTPATCTSNGYTTYTCTCGASYTEIIPQLTGHSYTASKVINPDCEKEGYTVYSCECGESYIDNKVSATGHNYQNGVCTDCDDVKEVDCSCNCHKGGLMGIIWRIIRIFIKLFKTNPVCACGVAHY